MGGEECSGMQVARMFLAGVDRMPEIQFRQFVMSLKFIDDKIGETGLKAK